MSTFTFNKNSLNLSVCKMVNEHADEVILTPNEVNVFVDENQQVQVTTKNLAHKTTPSVFRVLTVENFGGAFGRAAEGFESDTYWLPLAWVWEDPNGIKGGIEIGAIYLTPEEHEFKLLEA